jgi:hypothetical protein
MEGAGPKPNAGQLPVVYAAILPYEGEPTMTWIKTVSEAEAGPTLRQSYEAVYGLYPGEYRHEVPALRNADGGADSIVAAHSLIPEALKHAMSAFGVLLAPDLPLSRRQHEMIATVVSSLNRCFY